MPVEVGTSTIMSRKAQMMYRVADLASKLQNENCLWEHYVADFTDAVFL